MIGVCTRECNEMFSDHQRKAEEWKMKAGIQFFVKFRLQRCQTKTIVWTVILEWKEILKLPIVIFFIKVLEISTGTNRKGREAKKKI